MTNQSGRTAPADDAFAISDRRARPGGVGLMSDVFLFLDNLALPELPAIGPVETENHGAMVFLNRLSEEDSFSPNHRSRIAAVGQRRFPSDVFSWAPAQGQICFHGNASAKWTSPLRPIAGAG